MHATHTGGSTHRTCLGRNVAFEVAARHHAQEKSAVRGQKKSKGDTPRILVHMSRAGVRCVVLAVFVSGSGATSLPPPPPLPPLAPGVSVVRTAAEIQAGLDTAGAGGSVSFFVPPGTALQLEPLGGSQQQPLSLVGVRAEITSTGVGATLDAGFRSRCFDLQAGASLALRYIHLTGGLGSRGGGILVNSSNATLEACDVTNCTATGRGAPPGAPEAVREADAAAGGGVSLVGGSAISLTGCTIRECHSSSDLPGSGGGIRGEDGRAFSGALDLVGASSASLVGCSISRWGLSFSTLHSTFYPPMEQGGATSILLAHTGAPSACAASAPWRSAAPSGRPTAAC